jgi:cation diffusion facilitator CzcD-associated flavoprotein CzcO
LRNHAIDTAIVGAGPYALSLAAYLRHRGLDFRIFGRPMQFWRRHMPKGMMLKSDGFASSLSAPQPASSLGDYCDAHGHAYHDTHLPVPLSVFTDYALDFQRRFVPSLEESHVQQIEGVADGYRLRTDHGEVLTARRVAVAVGIGHFPLIPEPLACLPADLVSHSSAHHDLETFGGRDVTVVGGGASAVGLAVLLSEAGATVRLVAREPQLKFSSPPPSTPPTLWRRIRRPRSGIGPGWKSRVMTDAPQLFRRLPDAVRVGVVGRYLGPSSAWHLRDKCLERVELNLGATVVEARPCRSRIRLRLDRGDASESWIVTDHVIAATGYRPDLGRLPFLAGPLTGRLRQVANTPRLSPDFESSAPGLFFLGPIAANSFGPVMRFAYGADYAARRLSARLARPGR